MHLGHKSAYLEGPSLPTGGEESEVHRGQVTVKSHRRPLGPTPRSFGILPPPAWLLPFEIVPVVFGLADRPCPWAVIHESVERVFVDGVMFE